MGLFEGVFVSKIKGDVKKRNRKSMPMTILFAVAMHSTAFPRSSEMEPRPLDLSPFTIPAEQMYTLSTEMESEGVLC
jgi:hypothetical protein